MKSSDYIVHFLHSKDITVVFEVIGGMITHLIDSLSRFKKIRVVSMHHEQSAAFAVDAYGRMRGKPCVALATSGPGATNLLTGIGSCYFDSTPGIFITGQVNRNEQKGARKVRQSGFQETDIVTIANPLCKGCWKVERGEDIPAILEEAYWLACEGRPGPVLVDIPMDLQRVALPDFVKLSSQKEAVFKKKLNTLMQEFFQDLQRSQRPLILAGGGIRSSGSVDIFRDLVDQWKIPVVYSLMGVDSLGSDSPHRVGMIGSYGNRWSNHAIGKSDLLIVVGSRLDIRQTGSEKAFFSKNRIVWHLDCDEAEINAQVQGCKSLVGHLAESLNLLRNFASYIPEQKARALWSKEILDLKNQWPDVEEIKEINGVNPNHFCHELAKMSKQAQAYVVDVGQHQMWAGQSLDICSHQRFLTSGGMGAMGFALPGAVGVAMYDPKSPVVVIAGDGGFQMNIQELETIRKNNLPIKMVVINNHCLGMVRQFQETYFENRVQSTVWGYSAPDFASISKAYKINSAGIETIAEISKGLKLLWENPMEPFLLEVMIDQKANVYPKIAFGHPITEMEPFIAPIEMECT